MTCLIAHILMVVNCKVFGKNGMCILVASSCPCGAKWSSVEETNRLTFSRLSFALLVSVLLLFSVSCSYRNTRILPSQFFFFSLSHSLPFCWFKKKKRCQSGYKTKLDLNARQAFCYNPPTLPFIVVRSVRG